MPNKLTDDVKNEEKTEEEEEDDDDRTETASNASSSYNDLFEAEDGDEQVASNTKGGEPTVFESRFFVCKFEHRPKTTSEENDEKQKKTALEVPTENKENEAKEEIKVEVDGEQTPTIVKIENVEVSSLTIFPMFCFQLFPNFF